MNTNDNCGFAMFKWLATILSFAITLPGYFLDSSKMAFVITACVFIFCKFIENIEGITLNRTIFHSIACMVGSVIAVLIIGLCFYYFAAVFNCTEISHENNDDESKLICTQVTQGEENAEIDESVSVLSVQNKDSKDISDQRVWLVSNEEMSHFPLFKGELFYVVLFLGLSWYVLIETIFCGFDFVKYIFTRKKISSSRKQMNKVLDISI